MKTENCNEFTTGLCTRTLFQFDPTTLPCTKNHNIDSQRDFLASKVLFGHESEILKIYCNIISECETKIFLTAALLKGNIKNENNLRIDILLEKVNQKISENPTNYDLVRLYKSGIKGKEYVESDGLLKVCQVCGAVNDKAVCEHFMHEAYVKLRKIVENLKKRIFKFT